MDFNYDTSQVKPIKFLKTPPITEIEQEKVNVLFEAKAETFKVRSKNYKSTDKKIKSETNLFELITITCIQYRKGLWHVAENLKTVKEFLAKFPKEFFCVFVRQVPGNETYTVISICKRRSVPQSGACRPSDDLLMKYLKSPDTFKNKRLKYLPKLEKAPLAILGTVRLLGGENPVLMGNGYLNQRHYSGSNYYEVDVDISSSLIARQIAGTVVSWSQKFKVTEGFVIQGEEENELPEQMLCAWTLQHVAIQENCYHLTDSDLKFFEANPCPPE